MYDGIIANETTWSITLRADRKKATSGSAQEYCFIRRLFGLAHAGRLEKGFGKQASPT
jgi:hypothetical protein